MVSSKREGLLPGPGLAWSLWFLFFAALSAVFSCCLGPFFGRYLGYSSVPGPGLDSCVVVWFSFFVAVLVGAFVAFLVAVLVFVQPLFTKFTGLSTLVANCELTTVFNEFAVSDG